MERRVSEYAAGLIARIQKNMSREVLGSSVKEDEMEHIEFCLDCVYDEIEAYDRNYQKTIKDKKEAE